MVQRNGNGMGRIWLVATVAVALSCSGKVDTGSAVGAIDQKPVDGGPADGACAREEHATEGLPIDMYIMFDHSQSMSAALPDGGGTWWSAAQAAVKGFVDDPRSAGMEVGIQYFPLAGIAPVSCNAPYSTPDVELGPLPANAAAVAASIDAQKPDDFTPTGPALTGAIDHMKTWAASHPGHAPVVVLVTDGFPTECDPQKLSDVATIARTGLDTDPKVRTFVIGLNLGQAGDNLALISQAGGSGAPVLISGGDVGTALTTALLGIYDAPPQCTLAPSGP